MQMHICISLYLHFYVYLPTSLPVCVRVQCTDIDCTESYIRKV